MKLRRFLLIFVWILLLSSGPITVLRNTPISVAFSDSLVTINFFQRILGLLAFTLLFSQIMLGAFMSKWLQIIGARAYKYHVTEGLITYSIILAHPLMQTLLDYKISGPFAALISLLPGRNIYLNLGKIALFLLTMGVFAAYFRTKPFFRRNWLKFHILNYFAFLFVAVHSWNLGTDIKTFPFLLIYWSVISLVIFSLIYKLLYPSLRKKYVVGK